MRLSVTDDGSQSRGFHTIAEQVEELADMAANPHQRTPFGLSDLDAKVLGPAEGEVYTLIARSGVGKSLFATWTMIQNSHLPILFFSLEMPAHQVIQRLYSQAFDIAGDELVDATLKDRLPQNIMQLADLLPRQAIIDTSHLTLDDMSIQVDNFETWAGRRPALVIIDYLEEIGGTKAKSSGFEGVEATASRLKAWAKAERLSVLSLHQANLQMNEWEPPTRRSAKYGGHVESDVVIGAWRPGWDPKLTPREQEQQDHEICLNVIKNRVTGRLARQLSYVITRSLRIVPAALTHA